MFRPVPAALLAALVATSSLAVALSLAPGPVEERAFRPISQLERDPAVQALWGVAPPAGPRPALAALDLVEQPFHGRSPMDWARLASPARLGALEAPARTAHADLAEQVIRLDALAGAAPSAGQRAQIAAAAAALPSEVRGPFADLVEAVADAYEKQLLVAEDVQARFRDPLTTREPALSPEQRDATLARGDALLAAANAFRVAIADAPHATFEDPFGLVVLAGSGNDLHSPNPGTFPDAILLVDPAGDDTYTQRAGAACPVSLAMDCNNLALALLLDLDGDDAYSYAGEASLAQGAGAFGGLGILYDVAGSDRYETLMDRVTSSPIFMYVDGGSQGFGEAGYGLLLDTAGNDVYESAVRSTNGADIWMLGQGYGGLGGVGISADAGGYDEWISLGLGIPACARCGFQGVYTDGVGFYLGTGVMIDEGGNDDLYYAVNEGATTDYYAQGFGAFAGLGIMLDDAGNDLYDVTSHATRSFIDPLLNCEYGTGSLGGAGVFLDLGGDDTYLGVAISDSPNWFGNPSQAHTMNEGFGGIGAAYGLFIDVGGDDHHEMRASGASGMEDGRGVLFGGQTLIDTTGYGGNLAGNYLDLGGLDTYVGGPAAAQDSDVWLAGADVNAPLLDVQLW